MDRCSRCQSADLAVLVDASGELWVFRCGTCGFEEERDDSWVEGVL